MIWHYNKKHLITNWASLFYCNLKITGSKKIILKQKNYFKKNKSVKKEILLLKTYVKR